MSYKQTKHSSSLDNISTNIHPMGQYEEVRYELGIGTTIPLYSPVCLCLDGMNLDWKNMEFVILTVVPADNFGQTVHPKWWASRWFVGQNGVVIHSPCLMNDSSGPCGNYARRWCELVLNLGKEIRLLQARLSFYITDALMARKWYMTVAFSEQRSGCCLHPIRSRVRISLDSIREYYGQDKSFQIRRMAFTVTKS